LKLETLYQLPIILASKSPRRIELMQQAGLQFTVQLAGETDEQYPPELQREEIPLFLARMKADAFRRTVTVPDHTIVVTADTIVWINNRVLGKPAGREEAIDMLEALSGNMHQVYTGVCLTTNHKQHSFFAESKVFFRKLANEEITFYVDHYQPYDKAGAYGIQEWIGLVGIEKIEGSYNNVVGLPIQKLYSELCRFINVSGNA
jgi:septum formation protein